MKPIPTHDPPPTPPSSDLMHEGWRPGKARAPRYTADYYYSSTYERRIGMNWIALMKSFFSVIAVNIVVCGCAYFLYENPLRAIIIYGIIFAIILIVLMTFMLYDYFNRES